jgi:hypothetical protein
MLAVTVAVAGCGTSTTGDADSPAVAVDDLIATLRDTSGEHETHPPASADDVAATERAIGHRLPPSYTAFVTRYSNGAYLYGVQEVSAVGGGGGEQIIAIQDIDRNGQRPADERVTFREGTETVRYGNLIPFGLDSSGNEWCFIVAGSSGEYEVAYLDTDQGKLYGRLSGFQEWLARLVEEREELIRTLYDDDVIYDELGLG